MLGILLIYFVGKAFYELAHEHGKSRWGFAILGVVSYYVGIILTGVIIGLLLVFEITDVFNDLSSLVLDLIALPVGVLACWGLYKMLENNWSKQSKSNGNEALDSDLIK